MNEVANLSNLTVPRAVPQEPNDLKKQNVVNFRSEIGRNKPMSEEEQVDRFIKQQEKDRKQAKRMQYFNVGVMATLGAAALGSLFFMWKERQGMGQSKKELEQMWQNIKGSDKLEDLALPKSLTDFVQMFKKDFENPELVRRRGGRPILSFLMYGPPGTGKTSFAKAIAQEFPEAKFAKIDMTRLDSEWRSVGDRNLLNSLEMIDKEAGANPKKPYFVFLDEMDTIMMEDNSLNAKESNKTLNVFKDMLENYLKKHDNVVLIGATNLTIDAERGLASNGKKLDSAMLSRFEEKILVDLPTSKQASNKFAKIYGKDCCDLVGESLKNATDDELNKFTDFLTKYEHNVSFRTIESIANVAAHSIEEADKKVELIDLIKAVKKKRNEIRYDEADFTKLLQDLKINPTSI